MLTNTTGSTVWSTFYQPFGTTGNVYASVTQRLRFPGQSADTETGFSYNLNRDYMPNVGRYLETDPVGLYGGINSFNYVAANPLAQTDETGLDWTITTANGEQTHGTNPDSFIKAVTHAANLSIIQIDVQGHGNQNMQGFNPNDPSAAGGIGLGDDGTVLVGNGKQSQPLGLLLAQKLALRSQIDLKGCHVADGQNSLVAQISRELPSAAVQGCADFAFRPYNSTGNFTMCGTVISDEATFQNGSLLPTTNGRPATINLLSVIGSNFYYLLQRLGVL